MRTKYVVIMLCLLSTFVWVQTTQARDGAVVEASIPKEAAKAIEAGDWKEVAAALKPLAEGEKPAEPVRYWYGVALYHQKQYGTAVVHLNAALKANPHSLATAHYVARVCRHTKKSAAIEAIKPALAAFPNDPVVLTAAGRIENFVFWFKRRVGQDNTAALQHLEKAREYLSRAAALDPSNSETHLGLAKVLDRYGRTESAIKHILIADRLEPLGHEAYVMLGQLYAKIGDYSLAADAFAVAIESASAKTMGVEWERGMALWKARRSDEAVEVFRSIFSRNNMHTKVRFMLGRTAYDSGDYALALFAFRESFGADGKLDALIWSAKCAYVMAQDKLAVELVNQAIEEGKKRAGEGKEFYINSMWHFVRGQALWQMGDKKASVLDLEEAARKAPSNREYATWAIFAFRQLDDPFGIVRVAKRYGLKGDPREAMDVLRQVRQTWRWPRFKDHRGKRYKGGLPKQAFLAFAELYDKMNQNRAAVMMCYFAGWHSKGTVSSWSGWLAFRGGKHKEAEHTFDVLARVGSTERNKQRGIYGQAYMALLRRDADAARTHANAIKDEYLKRIVPTTLRWADVFSGDPNAADKLDAFDLLGAYGTWFQGWKYQRGLNVNGLIPGSPLEHTSPPLRPKDIIIRVGERYLQGWDSIEGLRKEPLPEGKTPVVIRRGEHVFEVVVDFAAARAAVANEIANKKEPSP